MHGSEYGVVDRNGKTGSCVGDIGGYREIREYLRVGRGGGGRGGGREEEGDVEEDSLDEKEKEWDRSIESESVLYRYLIRHHKVGGYSRCKCRECKRELMDSEVRYHCEECDDMDWCRECVEKKELLNVEGHDWRHEFILEMNE